MHARELVNLAAIVAAHGSSLVQGTQGISATGIEQYWIATKCRLDRWSWSLREFVAAAEAFEAEPRIDPTEIHGVFEEVLTGEVLSRIWTAVLCAHDRLRGTDLVEPIARSVLLGHLEARHRVLTLLVRGPGIAARQAAQFNSLRNISERWADLLIGYLCACNDLSEFAVDPSRALDFAQDFREARRHPGASQTWTLALASLHAAFRDGPSRRSPNADLNGRIAAAILCCFQPCVFDSTGLLRSLWMSRMTNTANDVQGLIEDLLAV
jgi:hypothetical protein